MAALAHRRLPSRSSLLGFFVFNLPHKIEYIQGMCNVQGKC